MGLENSLVDTIALSLHVAHPDWTTEGCLSQANGLAILLIEAINSGNLEGIGMVGTVVDPRTGFADKVVSVLDLSRLG